MSSENPAQEKTSAYKKREAMFVNEAADILGVSRQSVDREIKCGKLRAFRFGSRWLIPRAEIDRLLGGEINNG